MKKDRITRCLDALENLLPETCKKCEELYTVRREDSPTIRCAVCECGYHEDCLSQELKQSFNDLQNGLVGRLLWLCPRCDSHQCRGTQPVNHKTAAVRAPAPPATPTVAGAVEQLPQQVQEEQQRDREGAAGGGGEEDRPLADESRPVCKFYLQGGCRHGFTGKGCVDRHPKYCPVFRKWGHSGTQGCRGGKNCDNGPHPMMCRDSVTKLRCDKLDCPAKLHTSKCTRPPRTGVRRRGEEDRRGDAGAGRGGGEGRGGRDGGIGGVCRVAV